MAVHSILFALPVQRVATGSRLSIGHFKQTPRGLELNIYVLLRSNKSALHDYRKAVDT